MRWRKILKERDKFEKSRVPQDGYFCQNGKNLALEGPQISFWRNIGNLKYEIGRTRKQRYFLRKITRSLTENSK